MNIGDIGAILKMATTSPKEMAKIVKLLSVDVLKNLGDGKYRVAIERREFDATSKEKNLQKATYWANVTQESQTKLDISHAKIKPPLFEQMKLFDFKFDQEKIKQLLNDHMEIKNFTDELFEKLSSADTKEEFVTTSNILLSINQNVLTLPLFFEKYYGYFQIKKRYNKSQEKNYIDFYAALKNLGPIEGVITLDGTVVHSHVRVLFEHTKKILDDLKDELKFGKNMKIELVDDISPIYAPSLNSIMDIKI